jgi:chitinase
VNPAPVTGGNPPPIDGPKIVGYFVEWGIYGRNYNVTDIPADKLNVINYAFADISPAGEVVIYDRWAAVEKAFPGDSWEQMPRGNYNQLRKLKEKHPHLVTMISVGGWTLSGRFSDVALTPESREKFARSAVAFIVEHGFDGVDIDWEYPVGGGLESNKVRPEDKRNYTLLLRELRRQLDARGVLDGRKYYLSIASPAGDDKIRNLEPAGIAEACDWINIMTYDFAGGWEKKTGHQAPMFSPEGRGATNPSTLWSVDGAVRQFLDAGVDPQKLVVGVPFYGRGWTGVPATNSGIGQLSTGLPAGSYEAGIYDYKDLVAMIQAQPGVYPVFEDSKAEATFLYAPSANGLWVSFDDTQIVQRKVDYIKDLGLGGAMFWELSGDTKDPSTSLLEVLYQGFKPQGN